jgi:hypothetical protein
MASPWRVRGTSLAAAVLLTLLTLPPAASAAPRSEAQAARQTGFGIWQAIPDLWHMIQGIFERAGSSLDPFGNPQPNSISEREGSSPDPFGKPQPNSVFEKEGSSLDPFGNPKPNTVPDLPAAGTLAGR